MNRRNLLKGLVALSVSPVPTTTPAPLVTRQVAKTVTFASAYGASADTIRGIITDSALKDMMAAEDAHFLSMVDEIVKERIPKFPTPPKIATVRPPRCVFKAAASIA